MSQKVSCSLAGERGSIDLATELLHPSGKVRTVQQQIKPTTSVTPTPCAALTRYSSASTVQSALEIVPLPRAVGMPPLPLTGTPLVDAPRVPVVPPVRPLVPPLGPPNAPLALCPLPAGGCKAKAADVGRRPKTRYISCAPNSCCSDCLRLAQLSSARLTFPVRFLLPLSFSLFSLFRLAS